MGLSLVRCPFCDRRYNVTGIPPGTRVLCTSCRTVLTVPGNRFVAPPPFWHRFVPRSGAAQAAYTLFGGLILAAVAVFFVAMREGQPPKSDVASTPGTAVPAPAAQPVEPRDGVPVLNVSPTLRKILSEYHQDPRFQIHAPEELKPFVLVGERNAKADLPGIFTKFEDLLPKLYRTFMKEFGDSLKLEPVEGWELPIVFYTRRETYDAWWKRVYRKDSIPEVYGVFSYLERRVNLYYDLSLDSIDAGRTREVLLHEAIHQLVDHYSRHRNSNRPGAWWFQEGLGNYFEGYFVVGDEIEMSAGKMTSRLPLARELLTTRAADYQPLKKLMSWDVDDIWSSWLGNGSEKEAKNQVEKLQAHYAQAWAFVHFLRHAQDGKYRPLFNEYFQSELQGVGTTPWDEFTRLLNRHHPEMDLDKLDAEFREYLAKL